MVSHTDFPKILIMQYKLEKILHIPTSRVKSFLNTSSKVEWGGGGGGAEGAQQGYEMIDM